MNKSLTVLALLAGLLPGVAVAGPYDQPYGLIESGDRSQTRSQEPVAISRIDGKSPQNPRRPDPLAPGKHTVEISFSSARAVVGDNLKTTEIDVQPCKAVSGGRPVPHGRQRQVGSGRGCRGHRRVQEEVHAGPAGDQVIP